MEGGHLNFSVSALLDDAHKWTVRPRFEEAFKSPTASGDSFSPTPLQRSPQDPNLSREVMPKALGNENYSQGSQNCSHTEASMRLRLHACKAEAELPLVRRPQTPATQRHSALTTNDPTEASRTCVTPACGSNSYAGVPAHRTYSQPPEQWSVASRTAPASPPMFPPPPPPPIMMPAWTQAAPLMEILASGMLPLLFLQGFPDFATAAAAAAMGQQGFTPSTTTATTSPGLRRAVFTDAQRQELERAFRQHAYITKLERKTLAERLGLRDAQVKIWFQNRRMKWRNFRQQKPIDDAEVLSPLRRTSEENSASQETISPSAANNGSPAPANPYIPSDHDLLKRETEGENSDSTQGSVLARRPACEKVGPSSLETTELLSAWIPESPSRSDLNNFHLSKEQLCARALWG